MSFILTLLGALVGAFIGAILGIAASFVLAPIFGITSFEGASGYFALLLCAPVGGVIGFILGGIWTARRQGLHFAVAAGQVAVGFVVAVGGGAGIYWYPSLTDQDVLDPHGSGPAVLFEIRLPAGTSLPKWPLPEVSLYTSRHHNAGRLFERRFRLDGDRPVLVGMVELAYRAKHRTLTLAREGELSRVFQVLLPERPEPQKDFSPWERVVRVSEYHQDRSRPADSNDTHEIRYRVVQPEPSGALPGLD